jgi:hypothetical protein
MRRYTYKTFPEYKGGFGVGIEKELITTAARVAPPLSYYSRRRETKNTKKKYGKKNFECSILLGQQSTAQTNTQKIIATCHGR